MWGGGAADDAVHVLLVVGIPMQDIGLDWAWESDPILLQRYCRRHRRWVRRGASRWTWFGEEGSTFRGRVVHASELQRGTQYQVDDEKDGKRTHGWGKASEVFNGLKRLRASALGCTGIGSGGGFTTRPSMGEPVDLEPSRDDCRKGNVPRRAERYDVVEG